LLSATKTTKYEIDLQFGEVLQKGKKSNWFSGWKKTKVIKELFAKNLKLE
jgi:hypothetical protein